jgi:hypothetical protein
MRELSHSDQILKQLKSQRSNWQKVNVDVSMTSPSYFIMLTWQRQVMTSGDCDWEDVAGMDQYSVTRGMWLVKCGGATWPRHGQPRGTQLKIKWQC